jgi:hypothetical protein
LLVRSRGNAAKEASMTITLYVLVYIAISFIAGVFFGHFCSINKTEE